MSKIFQFFALLNEADMGLELTEQEQIRCDKLAEFTEMESTLSRRIILVNVTSKDILEKYPQDNSVPGCKSKDYDQRVMGAVSLRTTG